MPLPKSNEPPPRIRIERVEPTADCGRYPSKASVGERVVVSADIFRDGHDVLGAEVLYRAGAKRKYERAPMAPLGNDRWEGSFEVTSCGRWQFAIEAWTD